MATGFIERVKSFLIHPSKAFEKEHKTSMREAMIYGLIGFLILAIPYSIVFGILDILKASSLGIYTIPVLFMLILFGGFFGTFLGASWYHLWAYVFGARQGLKNTTRALFFANTPTYVLGWIPLVNFFAGIWSLILFGIGLTKLQKLSTKRAIGAILIAVLIPLIIVLIVVIWALGLNAVLPVNETTSAFSVLY
jgi:hypothetical protein